VADRPDEDLNVPVAEAHIATPRASRFLVQLCRHAEAMSGKALHPHGNGGDARPEVLHVDRSDTEGRITFTWGQCVLQSTSDTLTVRVDVADADQSQRIQDLLAADLERFGRRDDLKVTWQRAESSVAQADDAAASTGPAPARRKRGTTILLVVVAVLAIAAHVAVGGVALASWRWTSVAADILLAVVVLKIVGAAWLARRRFRGHRMRHAFPVSRHGHGRP
jgi:hypothetical protein